MKIRKFEDIIAWQRSRELVDKIYKGLGSCRDYSFKDQIQRAGVSIMNNIAEGFDRKGDKEFIRFLKISKGFCAEVRSMLYVAKDIGYFSPTDIDEVYVLTLKINKLLILLIQSLLKDSVVFQGPKGL